MHMVHQERREERSFPFIVAFLVSVGLHALLLLLSPLFAVAFESSARPRPEESVLRFSFAPTENATQDDARPEGMVPFETPEPQARAAAEPPPGTRPSLRPPSPPQPSQEPSRPPVEAPQTDSAAAEREEQREAPTEEQRPPASEPFPADADATYSDESRRETGSSSSAQTIDVAQAVREWGRAVARAREASPPGNSGGGEGRNMFVPDPANLPPTGFGVGNLTFESRDYDWSDYARQIYWEIWKAWHDRLYDTTDEFEKWMHQTGNPFLNHQVLVRFVIERDGDVTGIAVEAASGCPPLDDSSVTALDEVILSPLPADFPREREVVRALFVARGEIPAMRPSLSRMKAAGLF